MEWLANPQAWIALVTLTVLEVVLGIDNVIFISILAGKLPQHQQDRARMIGLSLAMLSRIALLFSLVWIIRLTAPLFGLFGKEFSGRDLILLAGGLFLMAKAVREIHDKLEGEEEHRSTRRAASLAGVLVQIMILDIIFSLDSVITAVGMVDELPVMIAAIVIAIGIMLVSSAAISTFVNKHPTVKMLALSFLLLIGFSLVAEALGHHIPKGYIYFTLTFSVFVEMINLRVRGGHPVTLHQRERD
jgi:predicted tellurium resistance membrane protein TerC